MSSEKPLVAAGAALILVNCTNGQPYILMGKRRGAHGAGTWSFPGGRVEPGEPISDMVLRELYEETGLGLDLDTAGLRPYRPHPFNNVEVDAQAWVTCLLIAWIDGAKPVAEVCEPDRCECWRWAVWDNLPRPLFAPVGALLKARGQTVLPVCEVCPSVRRDKCCADVAWRLTHS